MKYYVQFQVLSSGISYKEGKLINVSKFKIDAMGSDGVFILDGRNNLETMKTDAQNRIKQLTNLNIVGFKIMRGDRFTNSTQVYQS